MTVVFSDGDHLLEVYEMENFKSISHLEIDVRQLGVSKIHCFEALGT